MMAASVTACLRTSRKHSKYCPDSNHDTMNQAQNDALQLLWAILANICNNTQVLRPLHNDDSD